MMERTSLNFISHAVELDHIAFRVVECRDKYQIQSRRVYKGHVYIGTWQDVADSSPKCPENRECAINLAKSYFNSQIDFFDESTIWDSEKEPSSKYKELVSA